MSYNIHNVWQQEVWAANERAKKYINYYMGGLLEIQDPGQRFCLSFRVRRCSIRRLFDFWRSKASASG
jgi:hypothetical protein